MCFVSRSFSAALLLVTLIEIRDNSFFLQLQHFNEHILSQLLTIDSFYCCLDSVKGMRGNSFGVKLD